MIDIILDENNSVLYADYDITIGSTNIGTAEWADITLNSSNCTTIKIDSNTLPVDFCARLYFFIGGEFVLNTYEVERRLVEQQDAKIEIIIPKSITDLQARLVLAQMGRLAEVEAMAAADPTFYIWFDRALVWERTNPYVVNAGVALGLTETQFDELFVLGATL